MSATDEHEEYEAEFSDYYERTLAAARRAQVEQHLEGCARCRGEYEKFKETIGALSGLHKMSAPDTMPEQVKSTIHRRSAGRFFGRKAFGDRVPFEAIAVVALVMAAVLYLLLRSSSTGTLNEPLQRQKPSAPVAPGAEEVMPRP